MPGAKPGDLCGIDFPRKQLRLDGLRRNEYVGVAAANTRHEAPDVLTVGNDSVGVTVDVTDGRQRERVGRRPRLRPHRRPEDERPVPHLCACVGGRKYRAARERSDHRVVGATDRERVGGPVEAPGGERGAGKLRIQIAKPRWDVAAFPPVAQHLEIEIGREPFVERHPVGHEVVREERDRHNVETLAESPRTPPRGAAGTLARAVSPVVTEPRRLPLPPRLADFLQSRGRPANVDFGVGLCLALALAFLGWVDSGGVDLARNTYVEVALTVVGALAATTVALIGGTRAWPVTVLVLFAALAALTYASIAWSVQPSISWLEANRTLSYLAAFGAALAFARLFPERWPAIVGGIGATALLLSAYALLVKVFPGALGANDPLGRLRAPFDYWNAVGLIASMGIPPALWAGARREHGPVLRALAPAAIAIFLAVLLLSYSRGALVVAVVGTACWFALVPLRLRAALVLAIGLTGGGAIAAWALRTHSIYADRVSLSARASAGHAFGLVLLVVLVLTIAAAFAAAFAMDWIVLPRAARHRIGVALLCVVALIPVGGVAAMAESSRGLTGDVSHIWSKLTSTKSAVGDQPSRLVDLSNSRPSYWSEGFKVGEHDLLAGAGARGFQTAHLRYATNTWRVDAHSYLVETFADFGLIGVILSTALFVAWAIAANRSLELAPRRLRLMWAPPAADGAPAADQGHLSERVGLLTLFAIVLAFGLHSLIDWTWFVPGVTVPALICAGWLAGRGPLHSPVRRIARRRRLGQSPGTALSITALLALSVVAIWVTVQPLRSSGQYAAAVGAISRGQTGVALTDARAAAASDPVSVDPRFLLSVIYTGLGNRAEARAQLLKAVSTQPSNPATWAHLGCYDLGQHLPSAARELQRVLVLEPSQAELRASPPDFCAIVGGG